MKIFGASKYILFYITIFYFPGLIIYSIDPLPFFEKFKIISSPFLSFAISFAIFLSIFTVLHKALLRINFKMPIFSLDRYLKIIFFLLSILYSVSAVHFFLNYEMSFRHSSRLADASAFVTIAFFLKGVFNIYVATVVLNSNNKNADLSVISKLTLFLIAISTVLFFNSATDVLLVLILIIVMFWPRVFYRQFTMADFLLFGFFILLVGCAVLLAGYALKSNDPDLSFFSLPLLLWDTREEIYYRFAVSLFSLTALFDNINSFFDLSLEVFAGYIYTLGNRLSMLGLSSFQYENIATVERINYLNLFNETAERAGASPGPLAAMYYFPLYPIGFIAVPFLYVLVNNAVQKSVFSGKLNVIGYFIVFNLLSFIFESPFQFFNVLDPAFVNVMVMCIVFLFSNRFSYLRNNVEK